MKHFVFFSAFLLFFSMQACQPHQGEEPMSLEQLEESFLHPPESAKPWTWWHWVDGNVTKQGITYDLENMKRAGLGAALIFNVKLGLPDGSARFMNEEWLGLLDHAASECERLGLKLGIHNCDGWSQSGGPWITPELSMKKLVWSEVNVKGAGQFSASLPRPSVPTSPLVNDFYQDIAVIAYPSPVKERVNGPGSGLSVSGTIPEKELGNLFDNDHRTRAGFPLGSTDHPVAHQIVMRFPNPVTAHSFVIHQIEGFALPQVIPAKIEVSNNGLDFRQVATFELNWSFHDAPYPSISIAFPETTGRIFRFSFTGEHVFSEEISFSELELNTAPTIHYWEAKVGWARIREHGGEAPAFTRHPGPEYKTMSLSPRDVIPLDKVFVFRDKLLDNGHFEWDIPEGNWTILRVGYTSTGKTNSPATEEGRGLEADKLDVNAIRFHMEKFIGMLADRYGKKNLTSFRIFETDSWESGAQTWSKDLNKRFYSRTGYDLLPWIPLLTGGVIIDSYEASDKMLWDWRRFLADQIAQNYFQVVANFAEGKNLLYVAEASGRQMFMYDPIDYQRISPVPMGEFWVDTFRGEGVRVDNKVASSAAHLTGKKWVTSEAYTSRPDVSKWTQHPFTLKALGDEAFCEGINKFVFHTYTHQPYPELKPGFTMGPWGMHNHSGNTWWGRPVEAWFKYLARCQYMLQEGIFHADILAYLGSEVPSRLGKREEFIPAIPAGYDFDGCDFQALLDARIEDGQIVLPGGMKYKVLLLPDKKKMRVVEVRRIAALIRDGAVVIAPQIPEASPSLQDMGNADTEIQKIVRKTWNGNIIYTRDSLETILEKLNIPPDFSYSSQTGHPDIRFIHRKMAGCDVYFLSNQEKRSVTIEASFRQPSGKKLSLWDPATGKKYKAHVHDSPTNKLVSATLTLDPYGSVFAVFSDQYPKIEPSLGVAGEIEVKGNWSLQFSKEGGGPSEPLILDELIDWTRHPDFNVSHFSGTAVYKTKLSVSKDNLKKGTHFLLDLGQVKEMAQVLVNGQEAEMLWKPPFRTDISSLLTEGENNLEIKVTNLWVNRMIGDEYFPDEMKWKISSRGVMLPLKWPEWLINSKPRPETQRVTWTTRGKIYTKDDPLVPSGLLGPVQLIIAKEN